MEALLLKGTVIAETKTVSEAVSYYLDAKDLAPYRYEIFKSLADAYINDNRKQMALQMAQQAIKEFGENPRTLTVCSTCLYTFT